MEASANISNFAFFFFPVGNSRWVTAMDWSGQIEYAKADWKAFEVDGKEAGVFTGYGPLNFLKVHFSPVQCVNCLLSSDFHFSNF